MQLGWFNHLERRSFGEASKDELARPGKKLANATA
jgi:hypothetical protein